MDEESSCYFCGSMRDLQTHHIFGNAYRKKSTQWGFLVTLCAGCHTGQYGVHQNWVKNLTLKRWAQRKFEHEHSRQEFMTLFGRNYLEDEND